jgi:hypothetical protein
MGIEPTSEAWEASILPLYDARSGTNVAKPIQACKRGTHHASAHTRFFSGKARVRAAAAPPQALKRKQLTR